MFQSSSCPKTGCAISRLLAEGSARIVSILILPEDRMRPGGGLTTAIAQKFQSSSCPKTGCAVMVGGGGNVCRAVSILILPEDRMRLLGRHWRRFSAHVSILILPEDRMRPFGTEEDRLRLQVSILILPEDRMRPCPPAPVPISASSFNPHPARRQDAPTFKRGNSTSGPVFQSSSCPKTGCAAVLDMA